MEAFCEDSTGRGWDLEPSTLTGRNRHNRSGWPAGSRGTMRQDRRSRLTREATAGVVVDAPLTAEAARHDWKRMTWSLVVSVLSIVVIDVVLSGDNALVIGMASHRLAPRLRRWAIILGGAGAIGLRILFTIAAVFLLAIPFLQAVGGLLLTVIAYRLLSQEDAAHPDIQAKDSLAGAVRTIILADVVMSIDNILAVGGAARGSIELLIFGLLLSMPLILFGSSLIAALMNRLPWLVTVGSVVLTITAARMVVDDRIIASTIPAGWHLVALATLAVVLTLIVLLPVLLRRRRRASAAQREEKDDMVGVRTKRHEPDHAQRS